MICHTSSSLSVKIEQLAELIMMRKTIEWWLVRQEYLTCLDIAFPVPGMAPRTLQPFRAFQSLSKHLLAGSIA